MTILLLRRLLTTLVTLLGATVVVFVVLELLPGDPAAVILGTGAREDTLAALRAGSAPATPTACRSHS